MFTMQPERHALTAIGHSEFADGAGLQDPLPNRIVFVNPDADEQGLFKVHSELLMVRQAHHERLERASLDKPVLSLPKGSG